MTFEPLPPGFHSVFDCRKQRSNSEDRSLIAGNFTGLKGQRSALLIVFTAELTAMFNPDG